MNSNFEQPFGTYKPKRDVGFLKIIKNIGISRGFIAKWSRGQWKNKGYEIVDAEIRGIKFRLNITTNTIDSKLLTSSKYISKKEIQALKPTSVDGAFIDIGANIGYFSLSIASMGFKNILAIEPNPLTIKALQSNIKINGYENIIKLAPYCVGKEEELTFYSCADLGSSGVIKNELDSSAREIRVQSKTLESILYEYQIRKIDTLKIDIEGYEDVALMPFFEKVNNNLWPRVIVIEYTSQELWRDNILSYLLNSGYERTMITRGNMILHKK